MIALRDFESCAFCPKLCRHVCPVAVGSGREAATPTAMMTASWAWLNEQGTAESALASAQLCVDCGACTRACKLQRPVGELLAAVRAELDELSASRQPLGEIHGEGTLVAVLTDERQWHEALARRLERPVAWLSTSDQLGTASLDSKVGSQAALDRLRRRVAGRTLVVADAGSLAVAEAAGIDVVHLAELVDAPAAEAVQPTCRGPQLPGRAPPEALACCGARAPLSEAHPSIAEDVSRDAARRLGGTEVCMTDAVCARHLREHGAKVRDPIDWLMAEG